ncbi:hypothetical protein SAMN05444271_102235 [Halohasta litchfieldiae]|jgi:hypothetical protein|uniref:Uncharacterized protein n=1 Tax=Halohasta litchfieldiae TaxID=1073996 RepID=A0A1H6RIX3_9EURY|nr:hypothetical protein SAMN05444271_102235 [Halohasta litchfieldiae]
MLLASLARMDLSRRPVDGRGGSLSGQAVTASETHRQHIYWIGGRLSNQRPLRTGGGGFLLAVGLAVGVARFSVD